MQAIAAAIGRALKRTFVQVVSRWQLPTPNQTLALADGAPLSAKS